MGSFKSTIITEKGHNLMAKLTAGTAEMSFTKLKSSDHDYSGLTSSQLELLTSIESIKQEVSVSGVKIINDASVKVTGTIVNTQLKEGYYIKAIGLYAKDPDEGEILYSVTVANESDWMPPYNNISSADAIFDLVTVVSNAENVSIDVDPNAVVSITQFDSFKQTEFIESTGYGVISGLAVSAQSTPDMTVNVATGTLHMPDGTSLTPVAKSALTVTASNATNPRIDIIYVAANGTISYLAGTPASSPVAPSTPDGAVLLAQINVVANATTITSSNITDRRKFKNTTDNLAAQLSKKANDTDSTRTTTDKTVTGAINELNANKANQSALDTTNAHLALKAEKKYVDEQIQNMNSVVQGFYTTVSALTSAYPSGNSNNYVVTTDNYIYRWNGSAWTSTGYLFDENGIADGSVTPIKTSFFKKGKNLFNKSNAMSGYYVNYTTGVVSINASYFVSEFIPVEPNTVYTRSHAEQQAFFDSNKNYISGVYNKTTFTTPSNATYVKISDNISYLDTMQLEKGNVTTEYEAYGMYFDKTFSQKDELILTGVKSKNLFNKAKVVNGKYVQYNTGSISNSSSFSYSEHIPLSPNTNYYVSSNTNDKQIAFFDANGTYISGILQANGFTTPQNVSYCILSLETADLDTAQLELGTEKTDYTSYEVKVNENNLDLTSLKKNLTVDILDVLNYEKNMKILLPDYIYLITGEEFSIYWRNVIKLSNRLKNGDYYIRAQKVVDSVYSAVGEDYGYKWTYTPSVVEQFILEIRLCNVVTGAIVDKKLVTIVVSTKNQTVPKTARIVTLGDSFEDDCGVSKYLHDFVTESTNVTLNMIGLNDTGKVGVKDDAWSGRGYEWYFAAEKDYLRSDRPLSDAIWDAGWGENETNGWTTGQTYADLTATQKLHGMTKNEFYSPVQDGFSFQYFIDTYFPNIVPSTATGDHLDAVVSFAGLNDAIWKAPTELISKLPSFKTYIDFIINSIHSWDSNVKIVLHLVTPQGDEDESFMNSHNATFLHGVSAKYCQEIWNEFMLENYDTDAMRTNKVYVIPTNAHFDAKLGIRTKTITPVKFDLSYTETVTSDVHPTEIGAKYIADVARNFIINKIIH